ncbi:unnamed protein product [Spodoptera exigua]|nr:unnamed protein product [Spodoptera exigua]
MRLIGVIVLALVALTWADGPLPFETEDVEILNAEAGDNNYRLPEDLDPISYDIEITPYFTEETTPPGKSQFSFDGTVSIVFKVIKPNLNSFVIHENVRLVEGVRLFKTENDAVVPLLSGRQFERDTDHQFLKINLDTGTTLEVGAEYKLLVIYVGNINETPLSRGVFRGNYKDEKGVTRWYLATHLQPTHSRQAFPSFDEPGFKSTFRITINRPTSFSPTYSNMPLEVSLNQGERTKEIFRETPRMSAYLVTFHVSDGFKVIADNDDKERPYRILARSNAEGQGKYALEIGTPITNWLSDYLKIDYYSMAKYLKNDQIASPYWASGATENWGLVTYRELRLLYEEGETNAVDKLSIGTITAHELAHKWFGNLITCRWWDNVWINEGFASYFEYFAMHAAYPELELDDQFNIMYVQSALSADSATSTRALQHTVNSPTEVTGHFSGISYSKGASFLLMLKHLVSDDTFQQALYNFLDDRKYQHAFPSHLYDAFEKTLSESKQEIKTTEGNNLDIKSFMSYWVLEQGYPVLNVNVNREAGTIALEQERFFVSPTATATQQVWPLPITYTTQSSPNWTDLSPVKVMNTKTDTLQNVPTDGWVIFNVQQKNIYRVNYDTETWLKIAQQLQTDHNVIHHLNRAQIVDDVFALMRSEKLSFQVGFQVLQFLEKDTSFYSWYPAISGFNWLRNRFLHTEPLALFDQYVFRLLDNVIKDLGFEVEPNEHVTRTLNRFYLLNFACNMGHEECINNSVNRFKSYKSGVTTSVNPNLRRHTFCEGLRAGDFEDWSFIFKRRQGSNNQADEVAMLRALGCTKNDQARNEYLKNILTDDVKAQDRLNAFTFFYMGDQSNAKFALPFIKENVKEIEKAVVLPAWFQNIFANIAGYLDEEGLKEYETMLTSIQTEYPTAFTAGNSAIASARANIKWGSDKVEQIISVVDDLSPTTTPAPSSSEEPTTETPAPGSATVAFPATLMFLWTALAIILK